MNTWLDLEVAIKLLPELLPVDEGHVKRSGREACALATLDHPNIA